MTGVQTCALPICVQDLTPLKGLQSWSALYLDDNRVADLKPLLEVLKPDQNKPKVLIPFRSISLRNNPLTAQAKTTDLPQLEKLADSVTVQ